MVFDPPEQPLRIHADGAELRQAVLNVTLNAIEEVPRGGEVRWSLRPLDDGVVLCCDDDGPGFDPEALERALEPFFTRKEPGRGTGLGLAIAYSVVQRHGGSIELSNRPEGGAHVCLTLHDPQERDP